jgi:carbamoylphosphate synthase large subunit
MIGFGLRKFAAQSFIQIMTLPPNNIVGLVIGAGSEQVPSIKAAQQQGLYVVAVDQDPAAPGLKIADVAEVMNPNDSNAVIKFALNHSVSFTLPVPIGRLLNVQAEVHQALGLRGVRPEASTICTDKSHFYQLMKKAGLRVPNQQLILSPIDLKNLQPNKFEYPVVLKPRCGSGSRGVRVIENELQWPSFLAEAVADSPADGWVLESFIEGIVLGVDGAVVDNVAEITLVREKLMSPSPYRVELTHRGPATLPNDALQNLRNLIGASLAELNIQESMFHADIILPPDNDPVLIELSARPSGLGISSRMVPACTGINFLEQGLALHRFGKGNFRPKRYNPTILHFWNHPRGWLKKAPNLESLLRLPNVLSADIGWSIGQALNSPRDVKELLSSGHILISAPSWAEADETLNEAIGMFQGEEL